MSSFSFCFDTPPKVVCLPVIPPPLFAYQPISLYGFTPNTFFFFERRGSTYCSEPPGFYLLWRLVFGFLPPLMTRRFLALVYFEMAVFPLLSVRLSCFPGFFQVSYTPNSARPSSQFIPLPCPRQCGKYATCFQLPPSLYLICPSTASPSPHHIIDLFFCLVKSPSLRRFFFSLSTP